MYKHPKIDLLAAYNSRTGNGLVKNSVLPSAAKIPLVAYLRNNKSALRHKDFVQQAISELLQSNKVIKTNSMPHVVPSLSVSVQSSGKLRLILDLRHVNNYVRKQNIKYED
jgi:hypothetical protein